MSRSSERRWWTTAELAAEFGLTTKTVRRHIRRGWLRAHRLPDGHYRLPEEAIQRWLRRVELDDDDDDDA